MSYWIGAVEVTRVGEWVAPTPAEMLLPDVTADHLAAEQDWLAPFDASVTGSTAITR